jgi:hypothetical protein
MEYTLSLLQLRFNHILFKLPIKNQNENYDLFYKILYSNNNMNLKYILVKLEFSDYEIISLNKSHLMRINKNDVWLHKLKEFEEKILNIINMKVKKKIMLSCYNEFMNKQYLYCFQYHPNLKNLTLKISGVWENETHIGLVFKLYYNMSTEKLSNIIC